MKLVGSGVLVGRVLVIADLHVGYEDALNRRGVLVPRFQFSKMFNELKSLLDSVSPEVVVVAGDLKHEFGSISVQEWREVVKIIDLITSRAQLVLLKGNHDTILGPIAGKRRVEVRDYFVAGGVYVCHGDRIPKDADFRRARSVIIGHEHPAIALSDEARRETYKCFIRADYGRKKLLVLPSFSFVSEGADVLKGRFLSPFMKGVKFFEPVVVQDGKEYSFGRVEHQ